MDAEDQIGKRLAELRKQQGYRQEDFLELLQAQGLDWTQATLSRVEGGKRPIRLTEAFTISDALGIDPKDLGPDQTGIGYRIEALKLQFNRLKENAAEAISRRDSTRNGIAALRLGEALRKDDKSTFTAHGTPHRFIWLLSEWVKPDTLRSYREALSFLGIDSSFEGRSAGNEEERAQYLRDFKAWQGEILQAKFPNLTFTGDDSGFFSVPGLTDFLDIPTVDQGNDRHGR